MGTTVRSLPSVPPSYNFRRSIYWENNIPRKDYTYTQTTKFGKLIEGSFVSMEQVLVNLYPSHHQRHSTLEISIGLVYHRPHFKCVVKTFAFGNVNPTYFASSKCNGRAVCMVLPIPPPPRPSVSASPNPQTGHSGLQQEAPLRLPRGPAISDMDRVQGCQVCHALLPCGPTGTL